ncbi:HORMA domain-containing protein 1-like [Haliotis rubra]|uniref:HORMA domain-containing protein 1-like n=1 Tax=Haliotis rubra TaxID=36100 RepID=UPI001EE5BC09|nr:HORMA domain-containing protein 1-like [Haliotis rubra]
MTVEIDENPRLDIREAFYLRFIRLSHSRYLAGDLAVKTLIFVSTAQLLRPQEKTGTWASIFPNEQVTEQQSALFVKKLLAVAISNVTYLRAIFPEHAFGDRCLEDLNLKILRDDSSCPGACQVIKWVKGCFDALDKKYLRMLVIGIYLDPDNPETVIESYTFKFSYSAEGGIDIYRNSRKISSAYTAAETRKATIRLLRTIVVLTQTLKSLPDDVMMTMKLVYYDEVTPADYEPPGFKAAETDGFKFDEEPTNIKVGDVATPFHTVKMRIKTDSKQFEMKEDPAEEEEEVQEVSQEISNNGLDNEVMDVNDKTRETNPVKRQLPEEGERLVEDVRVPEISPAKPSPAVDNNSAEVMPLTSEVAADEYKVRCPCGCNEDDGLMIMCGVCKYWQHGVCFIITEEEDAPEEHICDVCTTGVKICTDPQLSDMTSIAVQATCLWRRALLACTDMSRVLAPHLARRLGIEITVAQGLMNRLEKEKFIRNPGKGKKLGKIVDKALVKKEGIQKYFQKKKTRGSQDLDKNKTTDEPHHIEVNGVDKNKDSKNEVEMLVEKTEGMNLCGRRLRSKESSKSKEPEICTITNVVESDRNRGKKRAFSKVDDSNEFEVCNSQDIEDSHCVQAKKKKASVVAKAIMV